MKSIQSITLTATAALLAGLVSNASAVVISDFNNPNLTDGFTAYSAGDGFKVNLSQVTSSSGVTNNPGFISTASGSDAVGRTNPPGSITTSGGAYAFQNAGDGRANSLVTENAFVASSVAGVYTLSVDLGRRNDNDGTQAGRYIFGFLSNYEAFQTSSTSFNNFNTFNSGADVGTFSFGINGSLLGARVVNYETEIAAGTFTTFTTTYTASAGESLKAFVIYDNTSNNFGQSAIDNLSYTVVAVPEPGSAIFAGLTTVGLAAIRRRRS